MKVRSICDCALWRVLAACCALALLLPAAADAHSTIRRDRFGVPHILADTEEEAAYATGFAQAEDHLKVLSRLFLRAKRRQAEFLGPEGLAEDLLMAHLRIREVAEERLKDLPKDMQRMLSGFAHGYNAYLHAHRSESEPWADDVTAVDVLAHARAVMLLDFALDLAPWRPAIREELKGSNMWVLGPSKTTSGKAILLANPHLNWAGSQLFYEMHIKVPGNINVSGAALLGVPLIGIGFNERLGWTTTVNRFDADDVYELEIDPTDPSYYRYDQRRLPFRTTALTIPVKQQEKVVPRSYTLKYSHLGPIIRSAQGKAYAYKSANLDLVEFLAQWHEMAKASSFSAFQSAVRMQALPMFNIGYADRDGNVFYVFNARLPVRPPGYDWTSAVPAGPKTEWLGMYPFAALPQVLNPTGGYIQNCNDSPWYVDTAASVNRAKYRAEDFGADRLTNRGQMSLQFLDGRKWSLQELMGRKFDYSFAPARRLKAELVELAKIRGLMAAAEVLEKWDGRMTAEATGAMLFDQWWREYSSVTSAPYKTKFDSAHPLSTPAGLADTRNAIETLGRVSNGLLKDFGRLDVPWGDQHRIRRGSLDLPVGGCGDCIRSIFYRAESDRKQVAVGGDSYILAVEFGPAPVAYSILAYSESSNPQSPHFADQTRLFVKGEYKRAWFTESDIRQNLEREYRPPQWP